MATNYTDRFTSQELYTDDDVVVKASNYYNWGGIKDDAAFYTFLNNLGMVESEGNIKFEINQSKSLRDRFATDAAFTLAAVDAVTAGVDLEVAFNPAPDFALRVGMAFHVIGTIAGTANSQALFRIDSGSANSWNIRTLSGTAGEISTTATILVSDIAEYSAGSPAPQEFKPSRSYNVMQMMDMAYGNGMVANSQDTKYDNSIDYQGREVQNELMIAMNRALLMNTTARMPVSGQDYGVMQGLPGFFNLSDTSGITDGVTGKVDSGVSVDFWNMRAWADSFTVGNRSKLAITSAHFSTEIAKAAAEAGETVRTKEIAFPRFNAMVRQIDLGNITLNLIVDRNLDVAAPIFSDGTNTAAYNKMLFAVDRDSFKLKYHLNKKLGLLMPTVRDVAPTNDERTTKKHILTGFSCAAWKLPSHGAYGITGS